MIWNTNYSQDFKPPVLEKWETRDPFSQTVFYLDASQGGTKGRRGKNSPEPQAVLRTQ